MKIVPLTPFRDGDTFASLFGDAFSECKKLAPAELLERARMKKWFRKGNSLAQDVPFPKNLDGEALPHGAVLNFDKKPIILHTRRALIWWLRLRNVNIPGSYPMHSFQSDCGGEEPGLVDLVQRALDSNAACMTVEQVGNPNSPPSPKRLTESLTLALSNTYTTHRYSGWEPWILSRSRLTIRRGSLWTTQQTVRKLQRSSDNSRFNREVVMVIGVGVTMMMGEVRVVEAMMSVRCGGVHDARVLGV